jgi:hypothetical protein
MSLSYDSPWHQSWENLHFDRRDSLRLSLQSLESALSLQMLRRPTRVDRDWYVEQVRSIFRPYLPPEESE